MGCDGDVGVGGPFLEFGGDGVPGGGAVAVDGESEEKLLPSSPRGGGNVVFGFRRDGVRLGHERIVCRRYVWYGAVRTVLIDLRFLFCFPFADLFF